MVLVDRVLLTYYSDNDEVVVGHLYEGIWYVLHAPIWIRGEGRANRNVIHGQ